MALCLNPPNDGSVELTAETVCDSCPTSIGKGTLLPFSTHQDSPYAVSHARVLFW